MPTVGSSDGARSIWYDEHSMTWTRPARRRRATGSAVPILPPSCASRPLAQRWAISAVVVDLPLVPVMATKRRVGRAGGALAAEQLDVADHLDAGAFAQALSTVQCGAGMGQRHAGRSTSAANPRQSAARKIAAECPPRGALARLRVVVPGRDLGAAGDERARARQARAAEAEQRDAFCRERS
jgi:hypothetical protein